MKITFHGAAGQVGRSCIELTTEQGRYVLDAGLWITEHGPEFPTELDEVEKVDAVFISHAHLDHTGALPLLVHEGLKCPVITNIETRLITKVLLKDSFKISRIEHDHVAYQKRDIDKIISMFKNVEYEKVEHFNDITYKLFRAGHIPGSASILIEAEGQKLLYTGDINTTETELLRGADTNYGNVDVLICESTYGNRSHPNRKQETTNFLNEIEEILDNQGIVLIPAFAVGRAQEILLTLSQKEFGVPIYVDGMARHICELFLEYPEFVKDGAKLKEAVDNAHFIFEQTQRDEITKKPCIIITTSGMVNGGPVMHYLKRIIRQENSGILMTGYQAHNTNGSHLLDESIAYIDGNRTIAKCKIKKFDFSAHAGLEELKEFVMKVMPKKVIFQHGDLEAIHNLIEWAKSEGFHAIAAKMNEPIMLHKD